MTNKIQIKVSADGVKYSRTSNFCLISFAILTDQHTLSSESKLYLAGYRYMIISAGVHTIAVIRAAETHENLAIDFKNVFSTINEYIENPPLVFLRGNMS